jgi:(R,R)-butanediol dehydrogenase / meso-butanediol dehydrogenase / diacetyl reductase
MTRQVHVHGVDDVRVDTVARPRAAAGEIVLRVDACGICGSDLTFIAQGGGAPGSAAPLPLGHEAAGTVVDVGAEVGGVTPGMRVFINPMIGGSDPAALRSVIGNGGTEGAFTDLLRVRNARLGETLFPIPDTVSAETAALVEPLAVALHGVTRGDPRPDETVVVYGCGPIGLGAIVWLRRLGVRRIVAVDRIASRLERATALGATHVVDGSKQDLRSALQAACGARNVAGIEVVDADLYLDMAGAAALVQDTIAFAKQGARMVITAVYKKPVEFDLRRMLLSEFTVTMAIGYDPAGLADIAAVLSELDADAHHLISHRFDFDRFAEAVQVAQSGECAKVMVLFPTPSPLAQ